MNLSILSEHRPPVIRDLTALDPEISPVVDTTAIALRRIQQMGRSFVPSSDITEEQATSLFTKDMSFAQKQSILAILNQHPVNDREAFVRDARDLLLDSEDGSERLEIIERLKIFPANERKVFMQYAELVDWRNWIKHADWVSAFTEFRLKMPANELADLMQQVKLLVSDFVDVSDKLGIINALAKMSPNEREVFVQNVKFLIPPKQNIHDEAKVILALAKIPGNEQKAFGKNLKCLIPDAMKTIDYQYEIIEALAKIPAKERAVFVQNVKCLSPNSMQPRWNIPDIMGLLIEIPAHEREAFVHNARLLLSDSMDREDRLSIIKLLQKIPANERDAAVKNAKCLILDSDLAPGFHRRDIIIRLLRRSADEREVMVQYAKLMIVDSMHYGARAHVIAILDAWIDEGLVQIPANELEAFAKYVKLLTPESLDVLQKFSIIKALANIPANGRAIFVQNVNFLLTDPKADAMRVEIIEKLADLSLDQQIDFIKTYKQNLSIDPDFLKTVFRHQESLVPEPNPKEPTIDEILAMGPDITLSPDLLHLSPQHQEMLKKAIKIKNYYNQNGYICFLHGQEPNRLILQLLIKEMAKIRKPEKHFKDPFVFFRSEKYFEQTAQQTDKIVEQLKKTIVNDNKQRDEVMSVDAYFANTSRGESANDWCKRARSVTPLLDKGSTDFDPLLVGVPAGASFVIKQKIADLMKIFSHKAPCGNLYVVAIPADKVMNYSYPAKPFGIYCDCHSEKETFQQLVQANHDVRPKCKNGDTTQWRLAASAMRAENGVRSFAISRYDDLQPFIEEYIQPLAAQIALVQNKSAKGKSRL